MANIALFIYGIKDLKGGGGAERFFADFFDEYNKSEIAKNKLYYIIDNSSVASLKEVNKLKSVSRLLQFRIYSNRFKNSLEFLQIIKLILTKRIQLIHIPLFDVSYIPLLKKLNDLPLFIRPKITINVVNCFVAPILSQKDHKQYNSIFNTYDPLFKDINVDGYFCWNQSFVDYVNQNKVFGVQPKLVSAINSRFSDTKNFFPAENKENLIAFASRLDEQKHADWFIKAIEILKAENKTGHWKFILCGNGPLREDLMKQAATKKLTDVLEFKIEGQMEKIFNRSRIYVSCQDYDNFPSLSMAEAMASGNAIVARNVGQTGLFVKNGVNGVLFDPDSPEGLANALSGIISDNKLCENMSRESIKLIKETHNVPNFIKQIDSFWASVLA